MQNFEPLDSTAEWISSIQIEQVMKQYEDVYPDFAFLGAVPSDYHMLPCCSWNFDTFTKNAKNQLAIIFNTDTHKGRGIHWVSLYINIGSGQIYFCDSMGDPPNGNIDLFINNFRKYYENKYQKKVIYEYNKNNFECDNDIYSCWFIIGKLAGKNFDELVKNYFYKKICNKMP